MVLVDAEPGGASVEFLNNLGRELEHKFIDGTSRKNMHLYGLEIDEWPPLRPASSSKSTPK